MRRFLLVLVAVALFGLLTSPPALAATFVVTSSADTVDAAPGDGFCANSIGGCTLRAAIQEANALAGADTITLPGTLGTYFISLPGQNEDAAATGDFDITSTVIINGDGASTTIIHANNSDRVFDVRSGALTLNNVTVRNGEAPVDPVVGVPVGGGILVNSATSLTLTNSIVRLNEINPGGFGGGILGLGLDAALPATTVVITNSTITQNFAPRLTPCVSDCGGGGGGIGLFGKVTATITNSTISGNTAGDGSGIGTGSGGGSDIATVTITGSTISGNTASRNGGGVNAGGGSSASGTLTIANSTISGNTAAELAGAIVFNENALVILTNVTVSNNSSGQGAAVYGENCAGACPSGELRVQNSIIANNTGAAPANCTTGGGNNITDLGFNLEFPGNVCGFVTSSVLADPLLGMLTSNGGPTQTHALNASSPALDAANDVACAVSPVSGVDQRGIARPSGAHCDIGAFELEQAPSLADLAIDFGGAGLWAFFNNTTYQQLHPFNPGPVVMGDLDNDGTDEVIAGFPGYGVWVWLNNTAWYQLHATDAFALATGDLDGNGRDEVLIDFPGFGVWVWENNTTWRQLHAQSPDRMILGDLDGNGRAEAILGFPGFGVWVWENNTSWRQLHTVDVEAFGIGDLDGGGRADLIADFPGFGLWVYSNNTSWFQLHASEATVITTGDIDGSGQDDAIISFPGFGVWAWMNSSGFKQLHPVDAEIVRTADIDGNGRADVVISFPGYGLWVWMNDTSWNQIHVQNPEGIAEGQLDGN